MSFTVPVFPITCAIYSGPWLTKGLHRLVSACNLAAGRRGRVFPDFQDSGVQVFSGPTYLLLPAGTDIRDMNCNVAAQDIVEVPTSSGRWYAVDLVDDAGKGFDNEHRYALLSKISERVDAARYPGLFWPVPIP